MFGARLNRPFSPAPRASTTSIRSTNRYRPIGPRVVSAPRGNSLWGGADWRGVRVLCYTATMRIARVILIVAGSMLVSACSSGGGFTAPAPISAIIAGNWIGTEESTPPGGGERATLAVTATIDQTGDTVSGQISPADGSQIFVSGSVFGSSVTFSVQYVAAPPVGQGCIGTARVSGSVSDSSIRFSVASLAATAPCAFATNLSYVLVRN